MTRYGFKGLSGTFYGLADDPITAQSILDGKRIKAKLECIVTNDDAIIEALF